MLVIGNPIVSYLLGGWGMGVYVQYQSAAILGRPAAGVTQPISDWLGRGPGGAQLKNGTDGKPMNPYAVNWVDYDGKTIVNLWISTAIATIPAARSCSTRKPGKQYRTASGPPINRASDTTVASAVLRKART